MKPLEPVILGRQVLCPACSFHLESKELPSGNVVYLHWYASDYIIEHYDWKPCINNAAIFLQTPSGLSRMEPIP
jgi:hypothetical protein